MFISLNYKKQIQISQLSSKVRAGFFICPADVVALAIVVVVEEKKIRRLGLLERQADKLSS